MLRGKPALSVFATWLLVAGGLGLAIVAVRSVFHTAATEVAPRSGSQSSAAQSGARDGDMAPVFEIPGYSGAAPVRLDAFKGHPIVLNFWASWCPPCRAEMKILETTYVRYKNRGVVFIGIDAQDDTWGESRLFLRRQGVTYPVGRDERGAVMRAYRVTGLPTTFLITSEGRVHGPALTGGFVDDKGARELAQGIEELLGGRIE